MTVTFQQVLAEGRKTAGGVFSCDMPCVPCVGDEVSMPDIFGYVTKVEWNWGIASQYQPNAWVYVGRYPNDEPSAKWSRQT